MDKGEASTSTARIDTPNFAAEETHEVSETWHCLSEPHPQALCKLYLEMLAQHC